MYVFGAIDFASALARIGRFLGYHVTVCDARAKFVTPERFPDVDELVVEWPDRFLERLRSTSEPRSASLRTTTSSTSRSSRSRSRAPRLHRRDGLAADDGAESERLRAEGVGDEELARIHAPIGLPIGSRSPEEVAVAIAAQIIAVFNEKAPRVSPAKAAAS